MGNTDDKYYVDESSQQKLRAMEARINRTETLLRQISGFGGPPPATFGKVITAYSPGDTKIEIRPVYFDDYSVIDSSGDSDMLIYITHVGVPSSEGLIALLAANEIIPYVRFQTEDQNGVMGVMAGGMHPDDLMSFAPQYTAAGEVGLRDGFVHVGEEDNIGTQVTDATDHDLGTDLKFYVKIVCAANASADGATTITTTATVQTTAGAWLDVVELDTPSTGDVTYNWQLGQISSEEYLPYWTGDITIPYPYQPHFESEIQYDEQNSIEIMGINTATDIDPPNVCLDMRRTGMRYRSGLLRSHDDNGRIRIGGLTASADITQNIKLNTLTYDLERTYNTHYYQYGMLQSITDDIVETVENWTTKVCTCCS